MTKRRRFMDESVYITYSDMALLMLVIFIFLFTIMVITLRMSSGGQNSDLKKQLESLQQRLAEAEADKKSLAKNLEEIVVNSDESYLEQILETSTFGRKDFDLFIEGLQNIPGEDIHLVVDASGSMHGLSSFLVPVLRLIVTKSGKRLSAITWFSDNDAETYTGTMGEMFDRLMRGAPFYGSMETIGNAFRIAARNTPPPGAYLLVGDEPSNDTIYYDKIPSPVFTLPLGRSDQATNMSYGTLAQKTGGRMLHLDFK
ncbi:MAG: hypothetical protein IDH49_09245 [Gammaproteobacteria bacterium]|nr:hypothetical protein [Gammaproteobacteria bacterium]